MSLHPILEACLLAVAFAVFDRSAFWFVYNTYNQVSNSSHATSYREGLLGRYASGLLGCILLVAGKTQGFTLLAVLGAILVIMPIALIVVKAMGSFHRSRK